MIFFNLFVAILSLLFVSCKKESDSIPKKLIEEIKTEETVNKINTEILIIDDTLSVIKEEALLSIKGYNDTIFVRLDRFSKDFVYDIKYATEYSFMGVKVYDCAECYLRIKTVKALLEANKEFMRLGYRIKLFDCYRPLDIQKRMWQILPHTNYVANPAKGSVHNRGAAVDLTLVDKEGNELEMGTPFDYFGHEAHHDYKNLPKEILENRKLLKRIMLKHNFISINSEWWHYNLIGATNYPISNFKWKCE